MKYILGIETAAGKLIMVDHNDVDDSKFLRTFFFFFRMVVHGKLVEPAVCLSDLYDVFLLDIVKDTRQNLWTMIYRSQ